MTFGVAAVFLLLSVIGVILSCRLIKKNKLIGTIIIILLSIVILTLAAYMCLTLIFVDAIKNQPPAV